MNKAPGTFFFIIFFSSPSTLETPSTMGPYMMATTVGVGSYFVLDNTTMAQYSISSISAEVETFIIEFD